MSQGFDPQGSQDSNALGNDLQDAIENSQRRRSSQSPNVSFSIFWSILSILLCIPTGIISLVYASKVNSLSASGAFKEAHQAAGKAKLWAWVSLFLGVITAVLAFVLLIPGIQMARIEAQDIQNHNNLKQLTLAMIFYDERNIIFPPAYTEDENGKRLHSWRVAILPYIEEEELYKQIHLDEPWDSEWNKQFHNKCPKVFQNPLARLAPGETTYAVVVGEKTVFPGSKGIGRSMILDGSTNTCMIAERSPVCWMDPNSDIPFEEAIKGVNKSPNGIRFFYPRPVLFGECDDNSSDGMKYFYSIKGTVTFCDGRTEELPADVPGDFIKALFTRNGLEIFDKSYQCEPSIDNETLLKLHNLSE